MKKYLQISIVLGAFFLLVWFRNGQAGDNQPIVAKTSPLPDNSSATPSTSSSNQSPALPAPSSPADTTQPSTSHPSPTPTPTSNSGQYKNGTFVGSVEDAFYGQVQVQVTISSGKISAVNFLQYPSDNRTSLRINSQAMPLLQQEAIAAQSANIDGVSGASATSPAFQRSLATALSQAS